MSDFNTHGQWRCETIYNNIIRVESKGSFNKEGYQKIVDDIKEQINLSHLTRYAILFYNYEYEGATADAYQFGAQAMAHFFDSGCVAFANVDNCSWSIEVEVRFADYRKDVEQMFRAFADERDAINWLKSVLDT
ncbi:hypothetical protein [Pseudoalteromonas rubra]|uniref:hypothetical protein n=1 Tax=Pseudoalteromonas rubra TaxID=43658 RepID=UPI000F7B742E|nr:hypothetical protein [Pseudoalteromonas rubra]